MKTKKLSQTIESFLNYEYKGDGKYYTTEYGSRSFRNSIFTNFSNKNSDCYEVIERGNDAPRGGRVGDYVIVKFNESFNERFGWFFEVKKNNEEAAKVAAEAKAKIMLELKIKFADYVANNPEAVSGWFEKMSNKSNKQCRTIKENIVAKVTKNHDFWGKYRIFDEVI